MTRYCSLPVAGDACPRQNDQKSDDWKIRAIFVIPKIINNKKFKKT